ncbi:unnamed protein product [Caenorhabditis sp. 36 PRJEB53466]|nr:unnamed protein product [Caenorhabditis sp. 36 PRJEB53466]
MIEYLEDILAWNRLEKYVKMFQKRANRLLVEQSQQRIPPPSWSMINGSELLYALGAVDETSALTSPLGVQMAELPLPPMHSKCLLKSDELECSEEIGKTLRFSTLFTAFCFSARPIHCNRISSATDSIFASRAEDVCFL